MDFGQLLALFVGNGILSLLIGSWINRRQNKAQVGLTEAQTRLTDTQADSEVVKASEASVNLSNAQMNSMANKVTLVELRVDTLETVLARSDLALSILVSHPGIRKDYPEEVRRAVRIRRGQEKWDNDTPVMFSPPSWESDSKDGI